MSTQDIILTRRISAPIDVVWDAWTNPETTKRWWGPRGFTCNSAFTDLTVGGRFTWNMHAPAEMGGFDMYTAGEYTRIEPLAVIDFTQWLGDADGNPIDPVATGMPADFPAEVRSSVRFERVPEGTLLTAVEYDWTVGEQRSLSESGLEQCIDKLEELLAS